MPNIKSAIKRVRQTEARTARNRATKTRVKNARKAVLAALEAGDLEAANARYSRFASAADKAAKRNVIHKNAASRLKANLAKTIKSKAAQA